MEDRLNWKNSTQLFILFRKIIEYIKFVLYKIYKILSSIVFGIFRLFLRVRYCTCMVLIKSSYLPLWRTASCFWNLGFAFNCLFFVHVFNHYLNKRWEIKILFQIVAFCCQSQVHYSTSIKISKVLHARFLAIMYFVKH